jgi:glucan-binding YG repeat protein
MLTGWYEAPSGMYYLDTSGAMIAGWLYDGNWYYLDSNGAMLQNTSRQISGKNYTFDASGKCTNP